MFTVKYFKYIIDLNNIEKIQIGHLQTIHKVKFHLASDYTEAFYFKLLEEIKESIEEWKENNYGIIEIFDVDLSQALHKIATPIYRDTNIGKLFQDMLAYKDEKGQSVPMLIEFIER